MTDKDRSEKLTLCSGELKTNKNINEINVHVPQKIDENQLKSNRR